MARTDDVQAEAIASVALTDEGLRRPGSCAELFRVFTALALQGFGGVLAVAQRELVEKQRWLTREDFLSLLSVSQVLPGPNVINLSLMLGDRYFGLRGALAAMAGMLLVPLLIVLAMAAAYQQAAHLPVVRDALRGMGAVSAGLVLSTALKLAPALKRNPLGRTGWWLVALTALAIAGLHWPLVAVVLGAGSLSMALVWRRLAP
jgi:chromate transporter